MRCRRAIFSDKLFLETGVQQALSNGHLLCFEFRWNGNIAVERSQRKISEFSREGMKTVQPVSPASNQHDLTEPRLNRTDEFRKCFEFSVLFAHR